MHVLRTPADEPPLTRRSIALILLAVMATVLPHATHLPPHLTASALAFALWRWLAVTRDWPLPGGAVRIVLGIAVAGAVMMHHGTIFGRDAGTALLVAMLALKLLEVRSYRDAMLALFLACFLTVVMAFHSQEIPVVAALVAALLLVTIAMIELNQGAVPRVARARLPVRQAGALMLRAAPLMIVMFLLFPRLPAPLWGLPADAQGATTGLSDTMDPGSISELARSEATAFRVTFDGEPPPPDALYWRGPVFWDTDGRTWSRGGGDGIPQRPDGPRFTPLGKPVDYRVLLEPSGQRWLFALDLPYDAPDWAEHTRDLHLVAERPVRALTGYRARSYPEYRTGAPTADERARALRLPDANPRSRALGRMWRTGAASDAAIVERALAHFRTEPFRYTLTPPRLDGEHPVDEFLFTSRSGFCEHYATAFTVLMRAAGIPARVVTGYQGGELNPVGGHMIVRQRDAHAWAEVWLDGAGWTRIDPTAAVAPERIERGSLGAERERSGLGAVPGGRALEGLIERAALGWDTVNARWNGWILAYGPTLQSAFLARFGLQGWLGMALAMVAGIAIALVSTMIASRALRGRGRDPVMRAYGRFRARLARRGVVDDPAEGPLAFAARARAARPELADAIDAITALYVDMRYGAGSPPGGLRRLRRAVATFRP